ncbi:hypothetical protein PUN28_008644 [Cardiocondyla obscurior]|uniref:Uncharacterized protein n=1 Tax=Cardiocondyla obscurior TaxID=286306 RepID=A0AAW2G0V8_9HYME
MNIRILFRKKRRIGRDTRIKKKKSKPCSGVAKKQKEKKKRIFKSKEHVKRRSRLRKTERLAHRVNSSGCYCICESRVSAKLQAQLAMRISADRFNPLFSNREAALAD